MRQPEVSKILQNVGSARAQSSLEFPGDVIDDLRMTKPKPTMSEKTKGLHLRVVDGRPELVPLMFHIHHMVREDEVLQWLIDHDYTGKRLVDWWQNDHHLSILSIPRFVVAQLEKEKKGRPLYALRDFLMR